jgi:hypothetical protein
MLVPFLFLVYINDPPNAIEQRAILILFADDTSILIRSPNDIQFPVAVIVLHNCGKSDSQIF